MRHPSPPSLRAAEDEPCPVLPPSASPARCARQAGASLPVVPERVALDADLELLARWPQDPGRAELEAYVADTYARAHGARLVHFLPLLVGLQSRDGRLLGVAGVRLAASPGRLFLESYLDAPVEQVLAGRLGAPVARRDLVEVGNLASHRPGGGCLLLGTLAHLLRELGTPIAVFTATRALRGSFARLGLHPVELAVADGRRLGADLADWGRYYETDPRVCAVPVDLVRASTASLAAARPELRAVWRRAVRLGRQLAREGHR